MKKFFQSLLARYMLIILLALFLLQISFIIIASIAVNLDVDEKEEYKAIENEWHKEATHLQNVSQNKVHQHFQKWQQQYPKASMFWVNQSGNLVDTLNVKQELPSKWTSAFTAKFIKNRYEGDPFTIIAFIGGDETNGFIVLELPREIFEPATQEIYDRYGNLLLIGIIVIISLFILVSFLFFWRIRKRLLHLQESMTTRDVDKLPVQTEVKRNDEVGQLEQTFNEMVQKLRKSKQREQQEEQLRKELIANISHDLRTPLTKIQSQIYSLEREPLTQAGKQVIKSLENSIADTDRLMENLMSYTLLMASKYNFEQKEIDVVRHVRQCMASWYPSFENAGFQIDINLKPFEVSNWKIDPIWLGRIIDNLLQNILRHAKFGRYVGISTETTNQYDAFVIQDKGKGMTSESNKAGAGIGLSIVDMMTKGMNLDWNIDSSEHGTIIKLIKYKQIALKK